LPSHVVCDIKTLDILLYSDQEVSNLEKQNSRLVPEFQANKLETDARKNWDLFYKRNETNFFKDRHWTTREFQELSGLSSQDKGARKTLLEVGCGVGNFVFPLLEDEVNLFIYCCDFSPRGVNFVKQHPNYDERRVKAFECDITTDSLFTELSENSVDLVSLIFVLSAIHPTKHSKVFSNLARVLRPGGVLLFRDYALYDMTMIRFAAGSKISENLYKRQDGTRTYFFSKNYLADLAEKSNFEMRENTVIHRRTVNKKEGVDAARRFVQAKLVKPVS